MEKYDKVLIYIAGFAIMEGYWDLGTDQNPALGSVLSEMDPFKWDNCLSLDPAYEDEYLAYLRTDYGDKLEFDYDEAIAIIKGYFLTYRALAKIKGYVLKQLGDEAAMKELFERTRAGDIYKIHRKYLQ